MSYKNSALSDYIYLISTQNRSDKRTELERKDPISNIIIRDNEEFINKISDGTSPESIIKGCVTVKKSSHYVVGSDARVGLAVKETCTAVSSTTNNDKISITVIIAADLHKHKKAIKSLTNLLVDICRRNGIPKLSLEDNDEDKRSLMLPSDMNKDLKKYIVDTLINSVNNSVDGYVVGDFHPRLSVDDDYWGNMQDPDSPAYEYYHGSKCFDPVGSWESDNSYGMPNCTAYAWGRFREIAEKYTGKLPSNVIRGNARDWYDDAPSRGYNVGKTPELGAIMCWWSSSAGHVAIVENISKDGKTLTLSESGYRGHYFWKGEATKTATGWYSSYVGGYTFQGFIYIPKLNINTNIGDSVEGYSDRQWVAKDNNDGSNPLTTKEKQNNAILFSRYFISKGWTLESIAGMLGNIASEGLFNPGQWEYTANVVGEYPNELPANDLDFDGIDSTTGEEIAVGYGFVGWTPYTKYAHWVHKTFGKDTEWRRNGDAQCARIEYERKEGLQWGYNGIVGEDPNDYGLPSLNSYSKSTKNVRDLALYFMWFYEKPWSGAYTEEHYNTRQTAAETWLEFLKTNDEIYGVSGPGITLVEQPNTKTLQLYGYAGGSKEKTNSVTLYYKWDATTINPKDKNSYDNVIKLDIGKPFIYNIRKPRLAKTIALYILQNNKKTDNDDKKVVSQHDTVYAKLKPSYPCVHIMNSSNKFVPYVPHINNSNNFDIYAPLIYLSDGWYAIFDSGIEKLNI